LNAREKLVFYSNQDGRQDNSYTVRMEKPISASVGCGFHVQNPSDSDADLSRDQNYQLL